jgi:hypothetical protein
MRLTLNIGLDVNATSTIAAAVALEIAKANGMIVYTHKVIQSDTEPTLVIDGLYAGRMIDLTKHMHQIAADLQQECIAVYQPLRGVGHLVGPKAIKWGEFSPEFFFLLNGKRLQESSAKAA